MTTDSISLTDDQRSLLEALVDRHADDSHPIKRDAIAETMECHPVTVSVRMQHLRALQLVESTSGPRGGYEPTPKAYAICPRPGTDGSVDVPTTDTGEGVGACEPRT